MNVELKCTCSNGTGTYISTYLISLSFVLARTFNCSAISFRFLNNMTFISSSLVDIMQSSPYLILHTLDVQAFIPAGSISSPRIRLIMLDFPELVSPYIKKITA